MIGFLANTNFLSAQLGQLPRLGNDVWLLQFVTLCTWFNFYGVMEYCLCNYLLRLEKRIAEARKEAREARVSSPPANQTIIGTVGSSDTVEVSTSPPPQRASQKDSIVTRDEIIATGFNRKMDLLMLSPKTHRMYFKDEHVDVFSRWFYPPAFLACALALYFTKL